MSDTTVCVLVTLQESFLVNDWQVPIKKTTNLYSHKAIQFIKSVISLLLQTTTDYLEPV